MRCLFISFFIALGQFSYSQNTDLKGFVKDSLTNKPLHGAHIQNITADKLVTSAPNGFFEMPVQVGDSLVVTYIGFEPYPIVITQELNETLSVTLRASSFELMDIVVTPFPEYERFKEMILEVNPPDSSISFSLPKVGKFAFYDPRTAPLDIDPLAPSVRIAFDLEPLTKRGREKKKLKKILEKERKWKIALQKFNRDWVGELTRLEGNELTSFIAFCDFSVDYIIETPLIELQDEVLALLKSFQKKDSKEEPNRYTPGAYIQKASLIPA